MEDEGRDVGHARFREINREFHGLILRATEFPVLEELVQRFYRQTETARALSIELPGSIEAVCREHRDIVEALKTRDPEASDLAAKRHFLNTATRLAHSLGHDEEF
jgi:DNA-binding GntR family transcriptional regulator